MMRKSEVEKYKSQLLEMRGRLIRQVIHIEEAIQEDAFSPGEVTKLPTHNADADSEGVDVEVTLAQTEEEILEQVEGALERIEKGTYGQCERCGRPIATERLDALPYTPNCVACAKILSESPED